MTSQNEQLLTGYPSIDKPWLKYYSEEAIKAPLPDLSMYEYLYNCNKDYFGNKALNYFGKRITYKKLFENIDKVATALLENGVKRGDIVSVCMLTTPETIYLLYAINKVGAVSNWLGLTSTVLDLHNQLDSTNSRLVFVVEMAYGSIAAAAKDTKIEKIVSVPIDYSMPTAIKVTARLNSKHPILNSISIKWKSFVEQGKNKEITHIKVSGSEMAVIIYTGGTTGIPKGVMLSNNAVCAFPAQALYSTNKSNLTHFDNCDKFACIIPLFLAYGLLACCHAPLCLRMELILSPDPSPAGVSKVLVANKTAHIVAGRLHFDALSKYAIENNKDLSFIKTAVYGGEQADRSWEERINTHLKQSGMKCSVMNYYGMTETAANALMTSDVYPSGLIPYGNVKVMICDPDDINNEYGYNQEGELCLSSESVMLGYYKKEKETSEMIFEKDGTRFLRTRDLATISKDGFVTITGRIKRIYSRTTSNLIQVRVYPMRIEEELNKSEYVERSAVIGIKDNVVAYRSIAYIILKDKTSDRKTAKESIEKLCFDYLPESHIPDEYVFVDDFPLTRAGKVDYRALEKMAEEQQAKED